MIVCFISALKLTTAANAILLQYTAPLYILLLEPKIFGIPLERINILVIVACVSGLLLILNDGLEFGSMRGIILGIISGMATAGVMIFQRLNVPEGKMSSIFYGNAAVFMIGLPFALQDLPKEWISWAALAYLGIFQLGLGYVLFSYGLKHVLAIEASLISMMEPLLLPLWVAQFHGEIPSQWTIAGGAIIILALIYKTLYRYYHNQKLRRSAIIKP